MKNGYYIATYIAHNPYLNLFRGGCGRHDMNIGLFNKNDHQIELIHYWELERVTRQKGHYQCFFDKEQEKQFIGQLLDSIGLSIEDIQCVWGLTDDFEETHRSERSVFTYKGLFFRVDEVFFSQKPFIVIECGDLDELMNNIMEDAEPFPYDLSYEELCDEVKYSLGIEPYPQE